MIEVEVTCLCNMMRLPDIGQVMTKGQVLYLDRDKAEASEDLRVAWRAKGINVKYVTRCQERVGADALTSIPTRRVPARVLPKRAVFVAEQPPGGGSRGATGGGFTGGGRKDRPGGPFRANGGPFTGFGGAGGGD